MKSAFATIVIGLIISTGPAMAAGSIFDRYAKDDGPAPVTNEPYEVVQPSQDPYGEDRRVNSKGQPLIRYVMEAGSLRHNIKQMMGQHGWTPVWSGIPDCIDWDVASPYVIQAPTLTKLVSVALKGYPLQSGLHIPNRVLAISPVGHFSEECQ